MEKLNELLVNYNRRENYFWKWSKIKLFFNDFPALDPAGPLFRDRGLSKKSAQYVQVLHTDNLYGNTKSLGHIEFFVNKGSMRQPGCLLHVCSHLRSIPIYFVSLWENNQLIGHDCDNQNSTETSVFGFFNDNTKEGKFCFNTTSTCPFVI